jgi:ABC-type transport system involved in Fe-S cluster assembly fused permease/ATPase subunit
MGLFDIVEIVSGYCGIDFIISQIIFFINTYNIDSIYAPYVLCYQFEFRFVFLYYHLPARSNLYVMIE